MGVSHARSSVMMVVFFTVLAILPYVPSGIEASPPLPDRSIFASTPSPSPSGVKNINEVALTRIKGEDYGKPGGRMGHFSWVGDVNGDGLNDIAVCAPGATGSDGAKGNGKVYVFFGNATKKLGVVDLKTAVPDITITARGVWLSKPNALPYLATADLTNELAVGDLNGDGHRDLVVPIPFSDLSTFTEIIWGTESGFPPVIDIDLSDMDKPGMSYIGDMGLLPRQDDVQTSNYLEVVDLDHDGKDEIVSGGMRPVGYYDYGKVIVRWGDSGNLTIIEDGNITTGFGRALDIGDVDGDGEYDLLVGGFRRNRDNDDMDLKGMAALVHDIKRLKGNYSLDIASIARPIIWGSRENDGFGRNVRLEDIDHDGKDDLIIAAPQADDILRTVVDCGRIYLFKGGDALSFPAEMDADIDAHSVVIGGLGRTNEDDVSTGDTIGTAFDLCDIDMDGQKEVFIGIFGRDATTTAGGERSKAGAVLVYRAQDLFPPLGGNVFLSYPSKYFTIEGEDMNDNLGWHLQVGDVNNDGVDDVVIGAVGEDGVDDSRPRAGEAYIIYGSCISIKELSLSGEGVKGSTLFSGGHEIDLAVDFRYGYEDLSSLSCTVVLSQGAKAANITLTEMGVSSVEGDKDGLRLVEGVSRVDTSRTLFRANVGARFDWEFLKEGNIDVSVIVLGPDNTSVLRNFPKAARVLKDVTLAGRVGIELNGEQVPAEGVWARPWDLLAMSGLDVVYVEDASKKAPEGSLEIGLYHRGGTVTSTGNHDGWELSMDLPHADAADLELKILYPGGQQAPPDMQMVGNVPLHVNIDNAAPDAPADLAARSNSTGIVSYDRDGDFDVSWTGSIGRAGDNNGSGVKEFLVGAGSGIVAATAPGGLFGTYYADDRMLETGIERVDSDMDFSTSEWGEFGPDPYLIPPGEFSVRWHGYFTPEFTGPQIFSVAGSGLCMMVMDGTIILPLSDVRAGTELPGITMDKGSKHPVEIYLVNLYDSAFFTFRIRDSSGAVVPVPSGQLYHPVNHTNVRMGSESLELTVTAVDWTGLMSSSSACEAYKDDAPPLVELLDHSVWTDDADPYVPVRITEMPRGSGSGIDLGSLSYRHFKDGEQPGSWWPVKVLSYTSGSPNLQEAGFTLHLRLNGEWHGWLQIRASDLAGNTVETGPSGLNVDLRPPDLRMVSPSNGSRHIGTEVEVKLLCDDGRGSGIDERTLTYRQRLRGGQWDDWSAFAVESDGNDLSQTGSVILPVGKAELQFSGSDTVGNRGESSIYALEIVATPVDRPPVPVISSPKNGTVWYAGDQVLLDAQGTSDDGLGMYSEVHMTWVSDVQGYLGSGNQLTVVLVWGTHEIFLYADDGTSGHNVSVSVTVEVRNRTAPDDGNNDDDEDGSGGLDPLFLVIVIFGSLLFAGLTLWAILAMNKRVQGPPQSMGVRKRSDDDAASVSEEKGEE